MKHGKKPTRKQMEIIKSAGLTSENWLISKNESDRILLVHRHIGTTRIIPL